jgi:AcrR family transcriptional regulator
MPNQSYHHGDLKAALIKAGLKLLDQEGYEGFSLRKVAKACNVSQTAPYRHFKNKEELIAAITVEALRAFNNALDEAIKLHPDNPRKQLTEMGVAYIKFFVENPEYLRLLFLSNLKEKMQPFYQCSSYAPDERDPFQTFYDTLVKCSDADPEQPIGNKEFMLYSWGLVHGIAILIANKDVPMDEDYVAISRNILENSFLGMS